MQYPVLIVISIHSHKPQSLPGSVKNNLWRKRHNHLGICFPYSYTLILHHTPWCCFFASICGLLAVSKGMEPNLNAYKPLLEYCACELPRYSASAFAFQFTVWTVMDFVILGSTAWNPDCDPCVCCGVKWESAELVSCPHHTHSRRSGNMGTKCGRIWVYQWKCCTFNQCSGMWTWGIEVLVLWV